MQGVNSNAVSQQQLDGLGTGPHRWAPLPRNPLNDTNGSNLKPMNPYGVAVGPFSRVQPGAGFGVYFPGHLLAILSQFVNVRRSPVMATRIALSANIHAVRMLQRQPTNPIPDGTLGPNYLPKRIPGPRISSTSPIIAPVYDYGAQPLG
jgi:hypothetical protein